MPVCADAPIVAHRDASKCINWHNYVSPEGFNIQYGHGSDFPEGIHECAFVGARKLRRNIFERLKDHRCQASRRRTEENNYYRLKIYAYIAQKDRRAGAITQAD